MKINIDNSPKITAAIKAAEGAAYTRALDPDDLICATNRAVQRLISLKIPEKHWTGSSISVYPESVPNSYRHSATGTYARLERFSTGWFVTEVKRIRCENCPHGNGRTEQLRLSDTARGAIPDLWVL